MLQKNLGIGKNAAYSLVNTKRIHSIRIGPKILVPKACVLDFLLEKEYNYNCNDGFTPLSRKEKTIA